MHGYAAGIGEIDTYCLNAAITIWRWATGHRLYWGGGKTSEEFTKPISLTAFVVVAVPRFFGVRVREGERETVFGRGGRGGRRGRARTSAVWTNRSGCTREGNRCHIASWLFLRLVLGRVGLSPGHADHSVHARVRGSAAKATALAMRCTTCRPACSASRVNDTIYEARALFGRAPGPKEKPCTTRNQTLQQVAYAFESNRGTNVQPRERRGAAAKKRTRRSLLL